MTELLVGDAAPKLILGEYLKGEPVAELVPGNVYVIEFWTSSCGPCRTSIPHLTELQKKFPQVTIIGVTPQADTMAARTLVAEMGEQIGYRIALDKLLTNDADESAVWWTNRWMARHWLLASYRLGVPCAFIVDRAGAVAWIGHPMEMDVPLTEIVDGIWDLPAKAHAYQVALTESKEREKFLLQMEVLKARDSAAVVAAIDKGIAVEPALEKMSGYMFPFQKLGSLMYDDAVKPSASAMPYVAYLVNALCRDDIRALLRLSTVLLGPHQMEAPGGGFAQETGFLDLALQALHQIEDLLCQHPQPDDFSPPYFMQFEANFARALLAKGKNSEALDRALRAQRWGKDARVPDKIMKQQEELVSECQRRLNQ
ncbi:MAG TPA: TlpA disulfide reductase family protein [Methylocella sp.]|nr:TlpA disulfide reductase family protein [Methylocella sp.]